MDSLPAKYADTAAPAATTGGIEAQACHLTAAVIETLSERNEPNTLENLPSEEEIWLATF